MREDHRAPPAAAGSAEAATAAGLPPDARVVAAAPVPAAARDPQRTVHHGDALTWLRANAPLVDASVITSLPDVSELPALGVEGWRRWFEEAAALTMSSVSPAGVAIFFQSDIKRDGIWFDKGAMVTRAAESLGMGMLFHKIVCRKPAGTVTYGRAGYSHLLCFASTLRPSLRRATPDVLGDPGFMPGNKAMGVKACVEACRFVLAETTTRTIVDPFCGWGTALAVANGMGMNAVGVDLSTRMCKRARQLRIELGEQGG